MPIDQGIHSAIKSNGVPAAPKQFSVYDALTQLQRTAVVDAIVSKYALDTNCPACGQRTYRNMLTTTAKGKGILEIKAREMHPDLAAQLSAG